MSYSSEVLADAPAGYWKLDETSGTTAADSSGNGFDGTYGGILDSAHLELGVAPLIGQGLAVNSHVTTNGSAFVSIPTESAFSVGGKITLEAWVEFTQTGIRPMISSDNGSGTGRYFQFRLNAGKPEVILCDTGGTLHTFTGPAAINDGLRHHVVATYDGAHCILYVDGAAVLTTAATFALRTTNAGLMLLEQLAGVTAAQYTGIFDEAAIYTTALSAARVLAHYNARGVLDVPTIGSVTAVHAPGLVGQAALPFIGSVTIVHAPSLVAQENLPFIGSVTAVYAPTLSGASSEVDVPFISSVTAVHAPAVPIVLTVSGVLDLVADDVAFYPIILSDATAILKLSADSPTLPGAVQTASGVLKLTADAPSLGGTVMPASAGVLRLLADAPVSGSTAPVSGKLRLVGDFPVLTGPVKPPSGKLFLKGDALAISGPVAPTTGRLMLRADAAAVFLATPPSGILLLLGDPPEFGIEALRLATSGILRLKADTPTIPNLQEPPPTPPPSSGGGVSMKVTV